MFPASSPRSQRDARPPKHRQVAGTRSTVAYTGRRVVRRDTRRAGAGTWTGQHGRPHRRPIDALTGLRFFAALIVAVSHFPQIIPIDGLHVALERQGAAGVTIFFVLSGFVLTYNYADTFARLDGGRPDVPARPPRQDLADQRRRPGDRHTARDLVGDRALARLVDRQPAHAPGAHPVQGHEHVEHPGVERVLRADLLLRLPVLRVLGARHVSAGRAGCCSWPWVSSPCRCCASSSSPSSPIAGSASPARAPRTSR